MKFRKKDLKCFSSIELRHLNILYKYEFGNYEVYPHTSEDISLAMLNHPNFKYESRGSSIGSQYIMINLKTNQEYDFTDYESW